MMLNGTSCKGETAKRKKTDKKDAAIGRLLVFHMAAVCFSLSGKSPPSMLMRLKIFRNKKNSRKSDCSG